MPNRNEGPPEPVEDLEDLDDEIPALMHEVLEDSDDEIPALMHDGMLEPDPESYIPIVLRDEAFRVRSTQEWAAGRMDLIRSVGVRAEGVMLPSYVRPDQAMLARIGRQKKAIILADVENMPFHDIFRREDQDQGMQLRQQNAIIWADQERWMPELVRIGE